MLHTPMSAIAAELPHSFRNTPAAFDRSSPSVAEAIARRVIIPRSKEGQPATNGDFHSAGFSQQQIGAHFAEAAAIADKVVIRQDAPAEPALDPWVADADYRLKRVDRAARTASGVVDLTAMILALREDGFTMREIGDLWPRIMEEVGLRLGKEAVL